MMLSKNNRRIKEILSSHRRMLDRLMLTLEEKNFIINSPYLTPLEATAILDAYNLIAESHEIIFEQKCRESGIYENTPVYTYKKK